jgi:tRNA A-37 threonylcarbamoyl transferase component Bud32
MEDFHSAQTLTKYIPLSFGWPPMRSGQRFRKFVMSVAEFLRGLHTADVNHGDLKASNLLVQEREAGWQVSLVDLDHVRFGRPLTRREKILNLAQLNASIPSSIGPMARLRFLRAYARDCSTASVRSLAADVLEMSRER